MGLNNVHLRHCFEKPFFGWRVAHVILSVTAGQFIRKTGQIKDVDEKPQGRRRRSDLWFLAHQSQLWRTLHLRPSA